MRYGEKKIRKKGTLNLMVNQNTTFPLHLYSRKNAVTIRFEVSENASKSPCSSKYKLKLRVWDHR
jgi:hypothetical protein